MDCRFKLKPPVQLIFVLSALFIMPFGCTDGKMYPVRVVENNNNETYKGIDTQIAEQTDADTGIACDSVSCDDGDPCTTDICTEGEGCQSIQIADCFSCSELNGAKCAAGEICLQNMLPAADSSDCCPAGQCLDQINRLIAEALPADTEVIVDGDVSDWEGIPRWPIAKVTLGVISSADDLSAGFAIQWDATSLYVLVEVNDDIFRVADSVSPSSNDVVELYFDLDASNPATTYDADEDWGLILQDSSTHRLNSWPVTSVFSSDTDNNWWVEMSIDWASAAITPVAGHIIGFDVMVDDDDGPDAGANRQGQMAWNDATGKLFMDATLFGLVRLKGDSNPGNLPVCSDGKCDSPENSLNCPLDCPN